MRVKYFIILFILLAIGSCDITESVGPDKEDIFLKLYGGVRMDEAHDFLQTDDGGFVIVGRTTSFSEADYDILIIRTDKDGNEIWMKKIGNELDNSANSIIYANDLSGFIICGETETESGDRDVLLIRTDLDGNEITSKNFGQTANDEFGEEVISAPSGGYYVLGNIIEPRRFYVFETDENFTIKEAGSYSRYNSASALGSEYEQAKAVVPYDESFYLLVGTTEDGNGGSITSGNKNIVMFLQTFTGTGNIRQSYYGNIEGTVSNDYASDMIKVTGGYIIAGYQINNNIKTPYIIKVQEDYRNKIWEKTYNEVLSGSNEPVSIIESNDGGYMVLMTSSVSQFGNQLGLMKLDVNGNKVWEQHLGSQNSDVAGSVIQLSDDHYVVCGSFSLGESNGQNLLKAGLVKTNSKGELKP